MYVTYWNLREQPFPVAAVDKQIYMTESHQEGLAKLYYLIDQRRVAGVLTGPDGSGKTLMLKLLLQRAVKAHHPVHFLDMFSDGTLAFVHQVLRILGVPDPDHTTTLPEALQTLQAHCRQGEASLPTTLLLIDNAQHLETAEDACLIHALCNLRNRASQPVFTLVLAGTEDIRASLMQYESVRCWIQFDWQLLSLTPGQTLEYVQHHIRAVGGDIWAFTEGALNLVHTCTQGIPLSINNLCDTALMLGFVTQVPNVTEEIILQAAKETGLELPAQQGDAGDTETSQLSSPHERF